MVYIIFFGFEPCMGDAMLADDLIPLLVDGCDSGRDSRQVFAMRHDAVIMDIQVFSSKFSSDL